MEFLQLVTANNRPLAAKKARGEVHQDGDWHRAAHIWISRKPDYILCGLRSLTKDTFPNRWDMIFGGHVEFGEAYQTTAERELNEELGIAVSPKTLIPLMIYRSVVRDRKNKIINREFRKVYLLNLDYSLKKFKIQREELQSIKYFKMNYLKKTLLSNSSKYRFIPEPKYYLEIIEIIKRLTQR